MCLEWFDFDGDDCFNNFQITVTNQDESRRYEFGRCAVSSLRKASRFFRNKTQLDLSGGFRNPDVRTYQVRHIDEGYLLVIKFEGSAITARISHSRGAAAGSRRILAILLRLVLRRADPIIIHILRRIISQERHAAAGGQVFNIFLPCWRGDEQMLAGGNFS